MIKWGVTVPAFREVFTYLFQSALMLSACHRNFNQFVSECFNVIRMCDKNQSFFFMWVFSFVDDADDASA